MSMLIFQSAKSAKAPAHHSTVPHWLANLGPLGLILVAVVDSSPIPLPIPGSTDLVLLWLVAHNGLAWLLVLSAVAGSLVGAYLTWRIGRKGGESALPRYVPARLLKRVVAWVEGHPILSVFLPAILPPPIPLSPFVLASGALGVSRNRFLLVFGAARALRYTFIAWLAVKYGRHVVRMWSSTIQAWSAPLLWAYGVLMVGGVCFGIWKVRSSRSQRSGVRGAVSQS
jgi:membrane protein YqaA with SNARE-associated domain